MNQRPVCEKSDSGRKRPHEHRTIKISTHEYHPAAVVKAQARATGLDSVRISCSHSHSLLEGHICTCTLGHVVETIAETTIYKVRTMHGYEQERRNERGIDLTRVSANLCAIRL